MDEFTRNTRTDFGEGYGDFQEDDLLKRFIAEQTTELPDNGFTDSVMRRLPDRSRRLNRVWTVFCLAVAVGLFIHFKGWIALATGILRLVNGALTGIAGQSFSSVVLTAFTVSCFVAYLLVSESGWFKSR